MGATVLVLREGVFPLVKLHQRDHGFVMMMRIVGEMEAYHWCKMSIDLTNMRRSKKAACLKTGNLSSQSPHRNCIRTCPLTRCRCETSTPNPLCKVQLNSFFGRRSRNPSSNPTLIRARIRPIQSIWKCLNVSKQQFSGWTYTVRFKPWFTMSSKMFTLGHVTWAQRAFRGEKSSHNMEL